MTTPLYEVEVLQHEADARLIQQFLLSDAAFDDPRTTPGEVAYFHAMPYDALAGRCVCLYVRNERGEIAGCSSYKENEQQTGGYEWDYLAVHRDYRKLGLALVLYEAMLERLREAGARYLLTYTCSLEQYGPVRKLFDRCGFVLTGRCPDYYYEGEDRLVYYLDLRGANAN
ncbi:Ribosomal protein S18 acetylase RimI [Paenibacillus sp. UNCCL117]|uniref:GNAT family N-acetyltransferase n=1 Tax=unclassified Paenibacillus TaxID=185978 RepID=UPI00088DAE42|nr:MULTISPECIES: GNAT family N-acetyltransferase [unclassified Paenibacillus]SDE18803.1 Ribosomal protein S18 acetylase RimI [Paenibacillus sp. cl123]SFW62143.1 Ribosomal protein S18 acetylase RimI [Paenibacillus sp. UNCCL117]